MIKVNLLCVAFLNLAIMFSSCERTSIPKREIRVRFYDGDTLLRQITGFNEYSQLDGISMTFYTNGKPRFMENYKENKLQGEAFYFYENGSLESKGNYANGKRNGIFYGYYENGIKRFEIIWKNDITSDYCFEYNNVNGKPMFYWEYDSSGKITYKATYNKLGEKIIKEEGKKR